MVSKQQRERELARAKWQRQQLRRQQAAAKARRRKIVLGVVLGLGAAAVAAWLGWQSAGGDAAPPEPPVTLPTQPLPSSAVPTDLLPTPRAPSTLRTPELSSSPTGSTP